MIEKERARERERERARARACVRARARARASRKARERERKRGRERERERERKGERVRGGSGRYRVQIQGRENRRGDAGAEGLARAGEEWCACPQDVHCHRVPAARIQPSVTRLDDTASVREVWLREMRGCTVSVFMSGVFGSGCYRYKHMQNAQNTNTGKTT